VVGGHFASTQVGLIFFHLLCPDWWNMALALATCIACMQAFRVSHPPAGSNPIIVFSSSTSMGFFIHPHFAWRMRTSHSALFYNNLPKQQTHPLYW